MRWMALLRRCGACLALAAALALGVVPGRALSLPELTINNVSAAEGQSGSTLFTFIVSLSAPAGVGGVTFDIATADHTATSADYDYLALSLTGQTIPAGASTASFAVSVNGDVKFELDETFLVNVSNVAGAVVTDGQGTGTILNDDAVVAADLSISVADSPDPVLVNAHLTYTLTVSNGGPSGATEVTLRDTLPSQTVFSALTAPAGWSCLTPAVGAAGEVVCSAAALGAGSPAGFSLVVKVVSGAAGEQILNTASVTGGEFDPFPENNSQTAATAIGSAITITELSTEARVLGLLQVWKLTARVVTGGGTPTGSVVFRDGTTLLGESALSDGVAVYEVSGLSVGEHALTAVYSGDEIYAGSVSGAVVVRALAFAALPLVRK